MEGEILFRDPLQFELKSEFLPGKSPCVQEFYLFVPAVLQINEQTYSKKQFYKDQTSLIRYKTPVFSLREVGLRSDCPLRRLEAGTVRQMDVDAELKLFANIVRSALRKACVEIVDGKKEPQIRAYIQESNRIIRLYKRLQKKYSLQPDYAGEFFFSSLSFYSTGLLKLCREESLSKDLEKALCQIVLELDEEQKNHISEQSDSPENEYILYRKSLLHKFVVDALLLKIQRRSVHDQYWPVFSSLAAGIAMFIYLIFFIWKGQYFVINSHPFIILSVLLYILKDRIKEGIKSLYKRQFLQYFADFRTFIYDRQGNYILGRLSESFSFLSKKELPREVLNVREQHVKSVLDEIKRPERVLYYKRELKLDTDQSLNSLFRFNIHQFLEKAGNPQVSYVNLNPESLELEEKTLPKVYHLNLLLATTYNRKTAKGKIGLPGPDELRKFRIIIDKNGIKRVESF